MKIAFISISDPYNRIARSGVPYSIFHELETGNEVIWVKPEACGLFAKSLLGLVHLFVGILHKSGYNTMHLPIVSRVLCHSVQKQLDRMDYDCIFTMGCMEVAYLKTDKPIFCRADAIVHSFPDYYVSNVPYFAKRWAYTVEERALHKYTRFFVPSQWVIDEIHKYKINEPDEKFVLIETGANLDKDYVNYPERTYGLDKTLHMLFVGYDIERKGINEAFETVTLLNEKYHQSAVLTVMGGKPSEEMLNSGYIRYAGNKNKNDNKELNEFYEEFSKADLFIFPTKAECHGIVNCEAAAYALPIFSYQTGGVPSYCIDDVNGRCLPTHATGKDFADSIIAAIRTKRMKEYSDNSRRFFEVKFNWNTWGQLVLPIMENIIYV